MKTAERILVTSLDLFNRHGEANVSSVDIAVELDISPGNLYYHFKGKEIIVAALFDLYREQMKTVLAATTGKTLSIEDFFYFLYLILEKGHLFQFLYHNPSDLAEKYPSVAKAFKNQLIAQERCIEGLLRTFSQQGLVSGSSEQVSQMAELIGLVFTQSSNYYALKGLDISDESHLYKSLATILFALLPYIKLGSDELYQLQQAILTHTLAGQLHNQDTEQTSGDQVSVQSSPSGAKPSNMST